MNEGVEGFEHCKRAARGKECGEADYPRKQNIEDRQFITVLICYVIPYERARQNAFTTTFRNGGAFVKRAHYAISLCLCR